MQLLTREQARELDLIAIDKNKILGTTLMENAGKNIASIVQSELITVHNPNIGIVCGKGNNGGDGFAAASILIDEGFKVSIYCLSSSENLSNDSLYFHDICSKKGVAIFYEKELPQLLPNFDLMIDAIVGTGFSGELYKEFVPWTKWLNECSATISVDIPSGLNANTGMCSSNAVKADQTITMDSAKIGMMLEPGKSHCGLIRCVDIGLPKTYKSRSPMEWNLLSDEQINSMIQNVEKTTHKYKQGKVLILAGSIGMTGAAFLSTMSALRSGAGITKTFAPSSLNAIYEKKITEGMTIPCEDSGNGFFLEENYDTIMNHVEWSDVIIIGPGLGSDSETAKLVLKLIKNINKPIVIDADGFQPFYNNIELFNEIHSKFVITPHLGEFSKITGIDSKILMDDLPKNINLFIKDFPGTLLLKNSPSFVAWEAKGCVNSNGNPGLATAGSGDVLTGIIAAFIAQGKSVEEAAQIGMFIHGKTGDELARVNGQRGLIASDLLNKIGQVISVYES